LIIDVLHSELAHVRNVFNEVSVLGILDDERPKVSEEEFGTFGAFK
jgi:hypothetical protein